MSTSNLASVWGNILEGRLKAHPDRDVSISTVGGDTFAGHIKSVGVSMVTLTAPGATETVIALEHIAAAELPIAYSDDPADN